MAWGAAYPWDVILVDAQGVAASRPGKPLFSGLSVTVSTGDRLGVLGVNGTGKSTLLRILTGATPPDEGRVLRGRDTTVAVLDQHDDLPQGTAVEVVQAAAGDREWEAEAVLDRLGMSSVADRPTGLLSGGQAKRVALARALVTDADLLVLDEPTNHLDLDAVDWLAQRLSGFAGGLVLVSHDRHVLASLTNRVIELDGGRGYVHDGGYAGYLESRAERLEREQAAEATRQNLARSELAWLRRGAPARTSKNKAHLRRARAVLAAPDRPGDLRSKGDADLLSVAGVSGGAAGDSGSGGSGSGGRGWGVNRHVDTPRLGDKVVELHGVGHRWPDSGPLFSGVDLMLANRERLGVVGPNGAGKTTLLEIIAGRLNPAEGTREVGPTVRIGYFGQRGPDVDPTARVRDVVAGPHRSPDWRDKALLERFWFGNDAQFAPVGQLSGGERRRLQLLVVLACQPNVLLLDEPTNDLDLDTLRLIEDFLEDWPGALVVISHDRAFLDRTIDDVVVVDGEGFSGRYPGGYAAWDTDRRQRGGRDRRQGKTLAVPGGSAKTKTPKAAASTGGASSGAEQPRPARSASTIRHELKAADRKVQKLAARVADLQAQLVDAGGDHEALRRLGDDLNVTMAELAVTEERWLELAEEAEQRSTKTRL